MSRINWNFTFYRQHVFPVSGIFLGKVMQVINAHQKPASENLAGPVTKLTFGKISPGCKG
jgi:hypothetical protein